MPKTTTIRGRRATRGGDDLPDTPAPPPASDPAATADATTEKATRVGFYLTDDETGVDWNRFKSASGKDLMQSLIRREAERMGYVKNAGNTREDAVTAPMLFGLVNALVTGAGQTLKLAPDEVTFLQLTPAEQALLNEGGHVDRLLGKYLGETTFKYADETFAAIVLVALVNAKVQGIRALRANHVGESRTASASATTAAASDAGQDR